MLREQHIITIFLNYNWTNDLSQHKRTVIKPFVDSKSNFALFYRQSNNFCHHTSPLCAERKTVCDREGNGGDLIVNDKFSMKAKGCVKERAFFSLQLFIIEFSHFITFFEKPSSFCS